MPQASEELRNIWGISEEKAINHLGISGFKLTKRYTWQHKDPNYKLTERDKSAMWFLICEWDFAGLDETHRNLS